MIISNILQIYSDDKHTAILIKGLDSSGKHYQVYLPNTRRQAKIKRLSPAQEIHKGQNGGGRRMVEQAV